MPAKSRSQQRLMGMVHAEKKGKLNTKGMDPDLKKKVKKIASGIKSKDAEKFARTKHKGLPEVKETYEPKCPQCRKRTLDRGPRDNQTGLPELKCRECGYVVGTKKVALESLKPTFKEYLIEITQQERKMLTPHPAVQKLYMKLKRQHGFVKRETFINKAIDQFNLSKPGLKQLLSQPSVRALRFDDEMPQHRGAEPRDGWGHVKNKHRRGSEASANRALAGNRPLSAAKLDIIKRLGG